MMNEFIDRKEVADLLSIHHRLIEKIMKADETFPKPIVISKRVRRWRYSDIMKWANSKFDEVKK